MIISSTRGGASRERTKDEMRRNEMQSTMRCPGSASPRRANELELYAYIMHALWVRKFRFRSYRLSQMWTLSDFFFFLYDVGRWHLKRIKYDLDRATLNFVFKKDTQKKRETIEKQLKS